MKDDGGFVKAGAVAQELLQGGLFGAADRQMGRSADGKRPAHLPISPSAQAPRFVKSLAQILLERPALAKFFDATDRDIAGLIYTEHIGEANAITIAQLAARFFADATRDNAARGIKKRIRGMRRIAKAMVCSQRVPPYGYYSPASLEEWERYRKELWRHTVAWLEICHDADHEGRWVAEQLGQLVLCWQENREQGIGNRE